MAEKKLKKKVKQVVEKKRFDNLPEAIDYLKSCSETNKRKFVETFDLAINSNIDTKTNQTVRGSATLPAGTGKDIKIVVFTDDEKLQKEALAAGAIMAGLEDLITKINEGFLGFDYCIATPDAMKSLSKAAKKLGPRGLMPNPKNENITNDIKKAVEEARKGKVNFKNDKCGIIHAGVGKVSFSTEDLKSNIMAVLNAVKYLKPEGLKGKYLKSMFLSTTMGPSVEVSVDNL